MIFMSNSIDTSKFVHIYSNLPFRVREEIIVVLNGEPISWNIAYKEIINNTEKGKEIFNKLISLKIIDE